VNVALVESGDIVQTLADGTYKLSTTFTGLGALEFALESYETQTIPFEIKEGSLLTRDVVLVAM
jgi:hypothetical protein